MFNLLTSLSSLLFSERETEISIKDLSDSQTNSLYSPGSYNSFIYLVSYQDPIVKAAIKENKFHNNIKAAQILGSWLSLWTKHQIVNTLYIPIPLSSKRKRDRGYNQVERILEAVNQNLPINTSSLRKKKHTLPQVELSRKDRLNNLKEAFTFHLTESDLENYQQIVIVDDVITTGTTLNEARATIAPLIPSHIKITCLALAH